MTLAWSIDRLTIIGSAGSLQNLYGDLQTGIITILEERAMRPQSQKELQSWVKVENTDVEPAENMVILNIAFTIEKKV